MYVQFYIVPCLFFALGSRTVVHPKARIVAEAGPVVIGEGNLIEERCEIINRYILLFSSVNFYYVLVSSVIDLFKVK